MSERWASDWGPAGRRLGDSRPLTTATEAPTGERRATEDTGPVAGNRSRLRPDTAGPLGDYLAPESRSDANEKGMNEGIYWANNLNKYLFEFQPKSIIEWCFRIIFFRQGAPPAVARRWQRQSRQFCYVKEPAVVSYHTRGVIQLNRILWKLFLTLERDSMSG